MLAFLAGLLAAAPGWAANRVWTSTGPPGGDALSLAEGADGKIYLLNGEPDRQHWEEDPIVFVSDDGGETWRDLGRRIPVGGVQQLAAHPKQPNLLFVTTRNKGVLRSENGGKNWSPINRGLRGWVERLEFGPAPTHPLLALASKRFDEYVGNPRLFELRRNGRKWKKVNDFFSYRLATHPRDPDLLYLSGKDPGTYKGGTWDVFRSEDGGATWERAGEGLDGRSLGFVAFAPNGRRRAYGGVGRVLESDGSWSDSGGIFETRDGRTWRLVSRLPKDRFLRSFSVHPERPREILASLSASVLDDDQRALALSRDGGATWELVGPEIERAGRALRLRSDPDTLFVPAETGTYRSTDGGRSWTVVEGPGLNVTIVPHVAVSTSARSGERWLWAVTGYRFDGGLYRRRDGGRRWRPVDLGGLRFQKVFSSPSGSLFATTTEGVAVSDDDGETWSEVEIAGSSPWEERAEVAFDPREPERAYLARNWVGLQVTMDGGRSWKPIETPLGESVFAVATDPDDPAVLYLGGDDGVTRSFDRGRTWEPLALKRAETRHLVIDPHHDRTLWALAESCCFNQDLYRSTDRGRTWKRIYLVDRVVEPRIESFAIDPERPGHLYAGLYDDCYRGCGGVWRSTDDGETWSRYNRGGLATLIVHSLAVSPEGRLHAGTNRRGVYSVSLGD